MRLHRFYIPTLRAVLGDTVQIKDERVLHQVTRVLRANVGDTLALFNGDGNELRAEILDIQTKAIGVAVTQVIEGYAPETSVTLCCAILKRSNFELVVQKATEVGVKDIVPIFTDHVVKTGLSKERLNKIAIEAAEQSGRTTVPVVHEPSQLSEALEASRKFGKQILFFDGSGDTLSKDLPQAKYSIYIGPEGGWSPEEVAVAKKSGATIASLGPLTFRAETAAIIATYTVGHGR